ARGTTSPATPRRRAVKPARNYAETSSVPPARASTFGALGDDKNDFQRVGVDDRHSSVRQHEVHVTFVIGDDLQYARRKPMQVNLPRHPRADVHREVDIRNRLDTMLVEHA